VHASSHRYSSCPAHPGLLADQSPSDYASFDEDHLGYLKVVEVQVEVETETEMETEMEVEVDHQGHRTQSQSRNQK
jgi:hypothetical protein